MTSTEIADVLEPFDKLVKSASAAWTPPRPADRENAARTLREVAVWLCQASPAQVGGFVQVMSAYVAAGEQIIGKCVGPDDDGNVPIPEEYTDQALVAARMWIEQSS